MNVLILTPNAVGSTLLQRMITIYMQFQDYGHPVINLHELTNGLVKYHNTVFDRELLGKSATAWGYHQSLREVVDLLSSVDHYKTSRLAHYHIKNRQDSVADQIPFYNYLNDNFLIISCRRQNVFEHALSMAMSKITKKLNVYSADEKLNSFFHLYRDGIILDPNSVVDTLEAYKTYLEWCNNYFSVSFYFSYEDHMPNIEKFIQSLPLSAGPKLCWNKQFGIDFNDWNRCSFMTSDLGSMALSHNTEFQNLLQQNQTLDDVKSAFEFVRQYNCVADPTWPRITSFEDFNNLPQNIQDECRNVFGLAADNSNAAMIHWESLQLPTHYTEFIDTHATAFNLANKQIQKFVDQGVMISAPPIKKQTLKEKQFLIKNFDQLVNTYNQWIAFNPHIAQPIDSTWLNQCINIENQFWTGDTEIKLAIN